MNRYVVIKLGGHALNQCDGTLALDAIADDVKELLRDGVRPIIVHGAGPQINAQLTASSHSTTFCRCAVPTDRI